MASNDFLVLIVLFFFSQFRLKIAKVVFEQQFTPLTANFACLVFRDIARCSESAVSCNVLHCFIRSILRLGHVGGPSWLRCGCGCSVCCGCGSS